MSNDTQKYLKLMEAAEAYVTEEKPKCQSPNDIVHFMRPIVADKKQEEMWALSIGIKNYLIAFHNVSRGLVDRTSCHAREIYRNAILDNASRIIIVHNHPSGDPTPSIADFSTTKSLKEAGKIIGIELVDSIVIGKRTEDRIVDYVSMREQDVM